MKSHLGIGELAIGGAVLSLGLTRDEASAMVQTWWDSYF
jgi:hypothetical protein